MMLSLRAQANLPSLPVIANCCTARFFAMRPPPVWRIARDLEAGNCNGMDSDD